MVGRWWISKETKADVNMSKRTSARSLTQHATRNALPAQRPRAFTLIELLVVISVIGILAAMIFPALSAVDSAKKRSKARAELVQVESAIALYKTKLGTYPPDNPNNNAVSNALYFELVGSTNSNGTFSTLDGSAQAGSVALNATFGVGGIANCAQGGGDEAHPAGKFLRGLKPSQSGEIVPGIRLLLCSVPWQTDNNYPLAGHPTWNPFRYNASHPTNNPTSFDLWVDILIRGKTNRICNWSDKPLIVGTPW
jgi:prepilin-type N-terminal cleavage/methylation domain-containing protein